MLTSTPIENHEVTEKYTKSKVKLEESLPRKSEQYIYQEPRFRRTNSYEEDERDHSPEFKKTPQNTIPSRNIIRFDNQEDDEEPDNPVHGSSIPSSLEIRGKIYHHVLFE